MSVSRPLISNNISPGRVQPPLSMGWALALQSSAAYVPSLMRKLTAVALFTELRKRAPTPPMPSLQVDPG